MTASKNSLRFYRLTQEERMNEELAKAKLHTINLLWQQNMGIFL